MAYTITKVASQLNSQQRIRGLTVYDNKVYGATDPGGRLFEWNGTNAWVQVAPMLNSRGRIWSLCTHNNKVYGTTEGIGGSTGNLFEWNGVDAWVQVAASLPLADTGNVFGSAVFNNTVYAGSGNAARLLEWNGTNAWVDVSGSAGFTQSWRLLVFENELYGGFQRSDLKKWNGVDAWVNLIQVASNTSYDDYLVPFIHNGKIYFTNSGPTRGGRLYEYNKVDNTYIQVAAPLASQTWMLAVSSYYSNIVVGTAESARVFSWDAVSSAWINELGNPDAQTYFFMFVIKDNKIYGSTGQTGLLYEINDTDPPPPPPPPLSEFSRGFVVGFATGKNS